MRPVKDMNERIVVRGNTNVCVWWCRHEATRGGVTLPFWVVVGSQPWGEDRDDPSLDENTGVFFRYGYPLPDGVGNSVLLPGPLDRESAVKAALTIAEKIAESRRSGSAVDAGSAGEIIPAGAGGREKKRWETPWQKVAERVLDPVKTKEGDSADKDGMAPPSM